MGFALQEKIHALVGARAPFARRLIMESDLADLRYLYYFGEYIGENELATARYLNALPQETIELIAQTFSEGFRKGFEVSRKDMAAKSIVGLHNRLGFERVIRQAVKNFTELGLEASFMRSTLSVLEGRSIARSGFYGATANKQYDFDHKGDQGLVLDEALKDKRLAALESAYAAVQEQAKKWAGSAAFETFGELPPTPQFKEEAIALKDEHHKLVVAYTQQASAIANRYLPREETSYTIIAFPLPEIGQRFAEIFRETIALNTLDYQLYRDVQQALIDALDQGEYVEVKGRGANKTALCIAMRPLAEPAKESNFENCLADVNIPVGEVFTSPKLAGTEGTLHVSRVFLGSLEYKELSLVIKEGMVVDYACANYEDLAENRKFIKDNLLHHHESLPVGEFAIGTNTTAYVVGREYGIAHLLPILIAEKTGPHFAFGDTCYSHSEDLAVFNPDGKEIVARDNEISLKRLAYSAEEKAAAYFNCHTDVTIPYDELGEITVVTKEQKRIPIFAEGRFVLNGCEELNKALL
jgi:leucyl aminopeptidase (aminopeptidase T)